MALLLPTLETELLEELFLLNVMSSCLQVEELEEKLLDQTQEVERLRSELVRLLDHIPEEPWEKTQHSYEYNLHTHSHTRARTHTHTHTHTHTPSCIMDVRKNDCTCFLVRS